MDVLPVDDIMGAPCPVERASREPAIIDGQQARPGVVAEPAAHYYFTPVNTNRSPRWNRYQRSLAIRMPCTQPCSSSMATTRS